MLLAITSLVALSAPVMLALREMESTAQVCSYRHWFFAVFMKVIYVYECYA